MMKKTLKVLEFVKKIAQKVIMSVNSVWLRKLINFILLFQSAGSLQDLHATSMEAKIAQQLNVTVWKDILVNCVNFVIGITFILCQMEPMAILIQ